MFLDGLDVLKLYLRTLPATAAKVSGSYFWKTCFPNTGRKKVSKRYTKLNFAVKYQMIMSWANVKVPFQTENQTDILSLLTGSLQH